MKINISDSMTINEIQDIFSDKYPYLKIEFFSKSHRIHVGSRREYMISSDTNIRDCRSQHHIGTLDIFPKTTVAELEIFFQDVFGLFVRNGNSDLVGGQIMKRILALCFFLSSCVTSEVVPPMKANLNGQAVVTYHPIATQIGEEILSALYDYAEAITPEVQ